MIPRPHRPTLAAALAVLGIFAVFAGDGLRGYFAPDEMMNLYRAWFLPLAEMLRNDRPVGLLFYRVMFSLFGLNPLPYHVVCFAILLGNLALLYRFCVRLTGSREVAALACLAGAYHAHLADFYYSADTIYDLLCFTFLFLAFTYYMDIRSAKGSPRPSARQTMTLLVLYVLALGSKEMAVALPAYVALYEVIYHRAQLRQWLVRGAWFMWASVPLTVWFIVQRTTGARRMTLNPAYAPHFTARVYIVAWKHYLFDLFYQTVRFNNFKAIALLLGLLGFALLMRKRELVFAWCVIMIGALPFLFVQPRGFFVMYMTLPGWYLYAGSLLVLLRGFAMRAFPQVAAALAVRPEQLALFAASAVVLIALHRAEKPSGNSWLPAAYDQVRPVMEQLAGRYPQLPRGARILFLDDPYPKDDFLLYFMFALRYRDKDIRVDRVKVDPALAQADRARYVHVFTLQGGSLREAPLY